MLHILYRPPLCSAWIGVGSTVTSGGVCVRDRWRHRDQPLPAASLRARFLAFILDAFVLFAFGIVLGSGLGLVLTFGPTSDLDEPTVYGGLNILTIAAAWLYYALMESSKRQATFGKARLGLVVTDLDGGRISFWRATGRYAAKWLSILTLFTGFFMAAFTERHQALHDMVAGCIVRRRPRA
jgi:uncharacterized RDD family membrane protein YckC